MRLHLAAYNNKQLPWLHQIKVNFSPIIKSSGGKTPKLALWLHENFRILGSSYLRLSHFWSMALICIDNVQLPCGRAKSSLQSALQTVGRVKEQAMEEAPLSREQTAREHSWDTQVGVTDWLIIHSSKTGWGVLSYRSSEAFLNKIRVLHKGRWEDRHWEGNQQRLGTNQCSGLIRRMNWKSGG